MSQAPSPANSRPPYQDYEPHLPVNALTLKTPDDKNWSLSPSSSKASLNYSKSFHERAKSQPRKISRKLSMRRHSLGYNLLNPLEEPPIERPHSHSGSRPFSAKTSTNEKKYSRSESLTSNSSATLSDSSLHTPTSQSSALSDSSPNSPSSQNSETGMFFSSTLSVETIASMLETRSGVELLLETKSKLIPTNKLHKKFRNKHFLQIAWEKGAKSIDIIEWLVKHGADINVKVHQGMNIKQLLATQYKVDDYIALLLVPDVPVTVEDIHTLLTSNFTQEPLKKQIPVFNSLASKLQQQTTNAKKMVDIDRKIDGHTLIEQALLKGCMPAFVHCILLGADLGKLFKTKLYPQPPEVLRQRYALNDQLLAFFQATKILYFPELLNALLYFQIGAKTIDTYLKRAKQAQPRSTISPDERFDGKKTAMEITLAQKGRGDVIVALVSFGFSPFNYTPQGKTLYQVLEQTNSVDSFVNAVDTDKSPTPLLLHCLAELPQSALACEKLLRLLKNQLTVEDKDKLSQDQLDQPVHQQTLLQRLWTSREANTATIVALLKLRVDLDLHVTEEVSLKEAIYHTKEYELLKTLFEQGLLSVELTDIDFAIKQSWPLPLLQKMLPACRRVINQPINNCTVFQHAIIQQNIQLMVELLTHDVDVCKPTSSNDTLLELAQQQGITDSLISGILKHDSCELNLIHALLMLQCSSEQLSQKLEAMDADKSNKVSLMCLRNDRNVLQLAWQCQSSPDILCVLFSHQVNANDDILEGNNVKTLLRLSERWDDLHQLLLNESCNIELIDLHDIIQKKWGTPLFRSALNRLLSERQSSVKKDDNQEHFLETKIGQHNLLEIICDSGDAESLEAIFLCGLQPHVGIAQRSILHRAASRNSLAILKVLIQHFRPTEAYEIKSLVSDDTLSLRSGETSSISSDETECGDNEELYRPDKLLGNTPVHYGMKNPNLEVVIYLLSHVDTAFLQTTKNHQKQTPYQIAFDNGKLILALNHLFQKQRELKPFSAEQDDIVQMYKQSAEREFLTEQAKYQQEANILQHRPNIEQLLANPDTEEPSLMSLQALSLTLQQQLTQNSLEREQLVESLKKQNAELKAEAERLKAELEKQTNTLVVPSPHQLTV
ncbi:hypothetical protein D5018_15560 [Parashewanella curva]|uniref:Uncharacterized protein n=1 Tax=Parashewanella curva TaxID=2338552 RepID=A0A3L8PXG4_9GAMM|nr:hypothetical protein [Parashewanella curva]RLV58762.1 hypothetical protein D5018_15560 [Parashewanella curva]